jgi:hypothetical protein
MFGLDSRVLRIVWTLVFCYQINEGKAVRT